MRSPLDYFLIRLGWRFGNTLLLVASIVAVFFLAGTPFVSGLVVSLGTLGYFGAFLAGIFFVSTFTVVPAAIVLFSIADTLHPALVALIAAFGAVAGDYLIFRFVRDGVIKEWEPILRKLGGTGVDCLFCSPFFAWFTPVVGAFFIASPLPDEFGIGLLGIARLKDYQFFLIALALHAAGILAVVFLARAF